MKVLVLIVVLIGTLISISNVVQAGTVLSCSLAASSAGNQGKWHGESKECVAGVKHFCSLPKHKQRFTDHARKGIKVLDNCSNGRIMPYTAIATFNLKGRYSGHAGIFMSCNSARKIIKVYDQWKSHPWQSRDIWNTAASTSDNPNQFYVVEY